MRLFHPAAIVLACSTLLAAGCAMTGTGADGTAVTKAPPPRPAACPPSLPKDAKCAVAHDVNGAYVWFAMPAQWNGTLVIHAHGGPELGDPEAKRGAEDLERWAVMVKAGYAWAGSTYRRGGYGVRMAAEDTVRARELAIDYFGPPHRVVLHGQSYGGDVAAKTAELYPATVNGKPLWDALLLTSGVLGGGTRSYDVRLDLRVVYQYLCHNHPLPQEPQYPLWMGLPADSTLTRDELAKRMDQCLGIRTAAASRTPEQQARLDTVLKVTGLPERTLVAHMSWATWLFQDMVQQRLGGRNPFGNIGAVYKGSGDDAALNAGVLRYKPDPIAVKALADDSDFSGKTTLPTLTLHAIDDPTAFVELENVYREDRESAGTADHLVQDFSDEHEHSYLSSPEYLALMAELLDWVDKGTQPSPATVLARCHTFEAAYGAGCRIVPDYKPQPLSTRVPARMP